MQDEQTAVMEFPPIHSKVRPWEDIRQDNLSQGVLYEHEADSAEAVMPVSKVALMGVQFRSQQVLHPGTVRQMRIGDRPHRLMSSIRIISCRPRTDGSYDVKGEFF